MSLMMVKKHEFISLYTLKTLLFKLDIKHFSNHFFVSCYFEDRSRKKRKRKRKRKLKKPS